MIRCRSRATFALLVLGTLVAGAAAADPGSPLGPTRLAADFAEHLDEILAAAPESTAAVADSVAGPVADSTAAPVPLAPAATVLARPPEPDIIGPIVGGVVGGAAGLYGGALLGLSLVDDRNDEWESLGAALLGGFIGEVVLLPVGVHLGNGARGSFGRDLLVSFLSGLAATALIGATGSTAAAVAGAALQLGFTVAQERHVARARADERARGAPSAP